MNKVILLFNLIFLCISLSVQGEIGILTVSTNSSDPLCFGQSNGSIGIEVTGVATPPFFYEWSNGLVNGEGEEESLFNWSIVGLMAGSYQITVTDKNECTWVGSVDILDPQLLELTNCIELSAASTGSMNGVGQVEIIGGVSPYDLNWTGPVSGNMSESTAGVYQITGLPAGEYTVTVTDVNNCTSNCMFTITEPGCSTGIIVDNVVSVSCNGGSDGAIDVSIANGTTPLQYNWSNGATTEDIANIPAGTYTLTVMDASNCTATETVTIAEPSELDLSDCMESTPVSTIGGNDGEGQITITGGTGLYDIDWGSGSLMGQTSGTILIPNLSANTYMVTVTDANNCTSNCMFIITEIVCSTDIIVDNVVSISCNGGNDGAIDVSIENGTTPLQYNWSNGATTEDIANIPAGTYTLTVMDASNCTATETVTITEPSELVLSDCMESTPVSTIGGNDGEGQITITGGTGLYDIDWGSGSLMGQTSGTILIPNLSANTYMVTVTDANNCTSNCMFTITEIVCLTDIIVDNILNISCNGGSDGAIDVSIANGTTPIQYNWSNGATTEDIANIPAGTYTLTVMDASNCTATETVTITEPSELVLSDCMESTPVNTIGDNDGVGQITITGGTGLYDINWGSGSLMGQTDGTILIPNLSANTYMVTVTDANSCTSNCMFTITEPSCDLQLSSTATNEICLGENNGTINLTVSNAINPITYAWSNGEITEDLLNLMPGAYTVTVTDNVGCTAIENTIIQEGVSIQSSVISNSPPTCNGGSNGMITLSTTGGSSPYNYSWDNGTNTNSGTGDIISNLISGSYTITVSDANCSTVINETVNSGILVTISNAPSNPQTCIAGGSIVLDVMSTGNSNSYNYEWNNMGSTGNGQGTIISNLSNGNYNITITDNNGCSATTNTVNVGLNDTAPTLSLTPTSGTLTCDESTIELITTATSNGMGNLSYVWSTGSNSESLEVNTPNTYTVTVTDDSNGCESTAFSIIDSDQNLPTANSTYNVPGITTITCGINSVGLTGATSTPTNGNLSYEWLDAQGVTVHMSTIYTMGTPGVYTLIVTDNDNGCISMPSTIEILEDMTPPSIDPISDIAFCDGFSGTLTGNSSTPNVSYQWTFPNTQVESTNEISVLDSGFYVLQVTDNINECTSIETVEVTVFENPTLSTDPIDPICIGETTSITANASNGNGNYTFNWTDQNGSTAGNGTTIFVNPVNSTGYLVTVTDGNNCTATTSTSVNVNELPSVFINEEGDNTGVSNSDGIVCLNDPSFNLIASGVGGSGSSIDSYIWSNSNNTSTVTISTGSPIIAQTYTVTITDSNGCTSTETKSVTINDLPQVNILVTDDTADPSDQILCEGLSATLDASSSGGDQFQWSNGSSNPDILVIPTMTSTYVLTVTESNTACSSISEQTITVKDLPTSKIEDVCSGFVNGYEIGATVFFCDASLNSNDDIINSWDWSFELNGNTEFQNETMAGNTVSTMVAESGSLKTCLRVRDNNACEDFECIQNYISTPNCTDQFSFTNPPLGNICDGDAVELTFNVLGTGGSSFTEVFFGEGQIQTSNSQTVNLSYTYSTSNTYFGYVNSWRTIGPMDTCFFQENFTVIVHPKPTLTLTTDDSEICSGDDTQLNFFFDSPATYEVTTNPTVLSTTSITPSNDNGQYLFPTNVSPTQDITYQVTSLTNTNTGCTADNNTLDSTSIKVNSKPEINISSIMEECEINNLDYTVIFEIINGTSPYNVNGNNIDNNTFTSSLIDADSSYSFIVTDSLGCQSEELNGDHTCGDCSLLDNVQMQVDSIKNVCIGDNFIVPIPNNLNQISPDWIVLYVLHEGSSNFIINPIDSVNRGTDFTTPPEFNSSNYSVNPDIPYYVSAIISNNDGTGLPDPDNPCYNNSGIKPGQPIYFRQIPTVETLYSSDDEICREDSLFINVVSEASGNLIDISWNFGTGSAITTEFDVPNTGNPYIIDLPFDNDWQDSVNITITQLRDVEYGCINDNLTDTETIQINDLPVIEIDPSSLDEPCEGGDLNILVLSPNSTSFTGTWVNGADTISQSSTLFLENLTSNQSGTLTIIDDNGCSTIEDYDFIVQPKPTPEIIGNVGSDTPCDSQFVDYQIDLPSNGNIYNWIVDGGVITSASNDSTTITVRWDRTSVTGVEGSLTVMEKAANSIQNDGCIGEFILPININTESAPDTTEVILFYSIDTEGKKSDYFLLSVDTSKCYQWGDANGAFQDNANANARTYFLDNLSSDNESLEGYYVDIWESDDDCGGSPCSSRSFYRSKEIATPKVEKEMTFEVFPNPATTEVSIRINTPVENQEFSLKVFDVSGRNILQEDFIVENGFLQNKINLENISFGYYVVSLQATSNGERWNIPLIIKP